MALPGRTPMENDLVLRKVFKYGPRTFDSVKRHRLVSKAFKEASEPEWNSFTTPLTIFQNEAMRQLHGKDTVGKTTTLFEFLQQENTKRSEYPQRYFVLKNWVIKREHYAASSSIGGGGEVRDQDLNRMFWTLHGEFVTVLTLKDCKIPSCERLFEKNFIKVLPDLERVSLLNCSLVGGPMIETRGSYFYDTCTAHARKDIDKHFTDDSDASKLRSICLFNLTYGNDCVLVPWPTLWELYSNLEEISVGHQPENCKMLAAALKTSCEPQRLKKLSIMDAVNAERDSTILYFHWRGLSFLQKLAIGCEHPFMESELEKILRTQSNNLAELHLYRSIFTTPYANVFSTWEMTNLTHLHLWGSVFENLNFLKLTPKLKLLKWNTIGYDEDSYMTRFLRKEKHTSYNPELAERIVKNTSGLPADFQLESMRTLEFERGPISFKCWQKLQEWMPGLTRLKCLVVGDHHFGLIGRRWPALEHIEMAHGSRVSSAGILEAVLVDMSFQSLKSFIWKACSCLDAAAKESQLWNEMQAAEVENALKNLAVNKVILPWKRIESAGNVLPLPDCRQNLYELAISMKDSHDVTHEAN